jgi:hypothetical protein
MKVYRLNAEKPQKVAEALLALYDIDVSAFRKKDDQYGLHLLKLALLQPEAFWIATLDNTAIGYLSLFTLRSDRLFKKLSKEAKKGTLDLPNLSSDFADDIVSVPHYKLKHVHFYIDAIAVTLGSKQFPIPSQISALARHELINAAKNDLALVNKASLCAIAVRQGISYIIRKYELPLEHIGGRQQSIVGDKKYRELFGARDMDNNRFNSILDGLAALGRNTRFGIRLGQHPISGTPTVEPFVEIT